jgi:glycerol-3-phosphate dehydrogenase (NAD(P)+)
MFGNMIGKGYSEISNDGNEYGCRRILCCKSAYKLNQAYGAKTPIIDAVHSILYEGQCKPCLKIDR